ncbi:MAG TPA: FAD-dependent oxidoreductase [Solirubrobacteraceae bacterium]|nr:FAD-dependent oxidoreductase [Solirubrobacteraceae bacterium]
MTDRDLEADVVIIGAGVIGAAIAFELSKRGYRTINTDKLPASGYGPTSNSCAIVRAHYSSREGVAMAYEGFSYWQGWSDYLGVTDDAGTARYVNSGTILLKSATGHHEKVLRHYRELGVEYEEWGLDELRTRMPIYDVRAFWPPKRPSDKRFWEEPEAELDGAIFTPGSGYVNDPQLATHNLQRAAESEGARFLFRSEVVAIRRDKDRVRGVTLASGQEIDAPIVVNVAGPHSFVINRMAGVEESMKVKTRALRHEVHHVPAPPGFDFEADGIHTSDGDIGIYFRPESGNHILVGSEDPECDPRVWVEQPDEYDRQVTEAQWEAQVYRLARRIPTLRIPHQRRGVVDLYDVSDDWIPIYDRSDLSGFYMAIGTSGNQFKNAPVVGHVMAELIERVEQGHNHDGDPVRVTCRYTGASLDLSFYSRLREINQNSSYSVNG